HPFAQAHPFKGLDELETVSLSEFKDEPFVVMKGSRFSKKFDTFFQEAHFTPNVYAASYTWENRKDYVRNGDALTFLDEIMVAHEPDSDRIAYYRMKSPTKFYNLAVIHRSYNQLPSHIQGFIEVAKDYSKYLIKDDSTE
ncbi:MAG: LysR family transcriptional regulator substrate-binding protein, partial [Firmicutes bacterium]|nr:LysR family transcriptional regulator substrate-binding protein [Bacillota bacterium]